MLYKPEDERQFNIFSFLEPFSVEIWILIGFFYICVSILLYFISKHVEVKTKR